MRLQFSCVWQSFECIILYDCILNVWHRAKRNSPAILYSLIGFHCFFCDMLLALSYRSSQSFEKNLSCFYSNAKVLSLKCKPNVNGNMYICFGAEVSSYANMVVLRFNCIQPIEVLCSKYLMVIYIFVDTYTTSIQSYANHFSMKNLVGERLLSISHEMYLGFSWFSRIYIFIFID